MMSYGYRQYYDRRPYRSRPWRYRPSRIAELQMNLGDVLGDIKRHFFSLPPEELSSFFDIYEDHHGPGARKYAEKTVGDWRRSVTSMSGQTAERIVALLPMVLPSEIRASLTERLWRRYAPREQIRITLSVAPGQPVDTSELIQRARAHLIAQVQAHQIPEGLKLTFRWLQCEDVKATEQLLMRLQDLDVELAVNDIAAVCAELAPVLHQNLEARIMAQHTRAIGAHELILTINRTQPIQSRRMGCSGALLVSLAGVASIIAIGV